MQPRRPATDEWIKRMWYKFIMEYYSVIKKIEAMLSARKCMGLEFVTLHEISQAQKDKYCMFSLMCGV
jgi:hypothetical protein